MNTHIISLKLRIILLLLVSNTSITINAQKMKEYKIEIKINTSKEVVWETITDFKDYPNWNTVLKMEQNESIIIGKKFKVTINNPNDKKSKFKAIAIKKEDYKSFAATQKMIGKWLFSATHYFIIKEIDKEHVMFIQKWKLTGILNSLFNKQIIKSLEHFKQMNDELKAKVENNNLNN